MPLICGGGGGDGAAQKSPDEQKADEELKKLQQKTEQTEQKVCSALVWHFPAVFPSCAFLSVWGHRVEVIPVDALK